MSALICEAIRTERLLEFDYHGQHRVVAPYCHGTSSRGKEVLRAVQVGGTAGGLGFGKLWLVEEMSEVRLVETRFSPDDPNYNPNDSAMTQIHCRV